MNIQQIKTEIATKCKVQLPNLVMVRQLNEQKEPTEWLSYWDNDSRLRITMHEEVFGKIKADPKNFTGMAIKKELVAATEDRDAYTRVIIITPKNIEAVF